MRNVSHLIFLLQLYLIIFLKYLFCLSVYLLTGICVDAAQTIRSETYLFNLMLKCK